MTERLQQLAGWMAADEDEHDFSAQVCADAKHADLDPESIAEFRRRWVARAKRDDLADE